MGKRTRPPGGPKPKNAQAEAQPFSLDPELVQQAKDVGFADEQIAAFDSEDSLRNAVSSLSPQTMAGEVKIHTALRPDNERNIKRIADVTVETETKMIQDGFYMTTERAKSSARADDEQRQLEGIINRRGIRMKLVKIDIHREYEPGADGRFFTEFKIYYNGPKEQA